VVQEEWNMKRAVLTGVLALVMAHMGCGGSESDPPGGAGGTDGGTAGTGGSSGDSGTGCGTDCNDGFNCTIDSCVAGKCTHAIGPNSGETACPTGQYCTVEQGCIAAPACADVSDCEKAFGDDACKANIRCDPASSICLFDILDKDSDNHPPQVCGGADCNDNDPLIHPGASETCDGEDQDCDGTVDNATAASAWCHSSLGNAWECSGGECACPPVNTCGAECVDVQNDPKNCGACAHECGALEACASGACQCPPANQCGSLCVDLQTDPEHCGTCDAACATGSTCVAGKCYAEPTTLVPADFGYFWSIAVDGGWVYWSDVDTDHYTTHRIDVNGVGPKTDLYYNYGGVWDIALGSSSAYLLARGWDLHDPAELVSVPKTGGASTSLQTMSNGGVERMRFDSGSVFWLQYDLTSGKGQARQLKLDDSTLWDLTPPGLDSPAGLALNQTDIFWTEGYVGDDIWTASRTGDWDTKVIAVGVRPVEHLLEADSDSVYFIGVSGSSGENYELQRIPTSGGQPTVLSTFSSGYAPPNDLVLDGSDVIVVLDAGQIVRVPKVGGVAEVLAAAESGPRRLAADASAYYWTSEVGVRKLAK